MNLLLLACLSPLIAADEPEAWYGELRLTQFTADTEEKCDTFTDCDLQFVIPRKPGWIYIRDEIKTDVAKNKNKNTWTVDETYGYTNDDVHWGVVESVEIELEVCPPLPFTIDLRY